MMTDLRDLLSKSLLHHTATAGTNTRHIVYWSGCYQSTIFPLHYFILAYLHDDTTLRCAWYVTCDQLAHRQNKFISTLMQIFLLYCFLYFLCRWFREGIPASSGLAPFFFLLSPFYFLLSTFSFLLSWQWFRDGSPASSGLAPLLNFLLSPFFFLLSSFYFLLSSFSFLLSPFCWKSIWMPPRDVRYEYLVGVKVQPIHTVGMTIQIASTKP